jgi:hypothetical protein
MLNIVLWELFKRLVAPQSLNKLIATYGEARLKELLAQTAAESGEAGIRATAKAMEAAQDDFGNNTWFGGFDSSNINQIRYDAKTSTMGVMFNNGSIYEYYDVPRSVAYTFVTWPGSKGKWFWDNIRGGNPKTHNYAYAKIGAGTTTRENRFRESRYKSTHKKYWG